MQFEKSSLSYLKKLKKNNNRDWFAEHKPTFIEAQNNAKQLYAEIRNNLEEHDEIEKFKLFRIYRDVRFSKDRITLGELDCLLYKNGNPIHLEVIYKFYLFDPTKQGIHCWIGPNKKDRLVEKLEKLQQKQLPLLYAKECEKYLKSISLHSSDFSQQVYFKAQLFVPLGMQTSIDININTDCIIGFYCTPLKLTKFKNAKFYIPSKKDWLIIPHTNVAWMGHEKYLEQSKNYLDRQFSPLCWMKTTTGELKKFFLIWWEV